MSGKSDQSRITRSESAVVRDRRRKAWFSVDNIVIDQYGQRIGPGALAVYMALCRRANNDEGAAAISHRRLCLDAGVKSVTTLKKYLRTLWSWGLIDIRPRFEEGGQRANEYILLVPAKTPHQNVTPHQNMMGAPSDPEPRPGTNRVPGPGSKDAHVKKNSIEENSNEVKGSTLRSVIRTINRMKPYIEDGLTVGHIIEMGVITAGDWEAVRTVSVGRSQTRDWRTK